MADLDPLVTGLMWVGVDAHDVTMTIDSASTTKMFLDLNIIL